VSVFGFLSRDSSDLLRVRAELLAERELCELLHASVINPEDDSLAFLALDAYAKNRGGKIVGRQ
jgi:hypothetical protein